MGLLKIYDSGSKEQFKGDTNMFFNIDKQVNNWVKISGRFKCFNEFFVNQYAEEFCEIYLESRRKSGVYDTCRVVIPINLIEEVGELREGDRLEVRGQIRSHNFLDDRCNSHLKVYVHAKKLSRLLNEAEDVNEVEVTGFLVKPATYRLTPLGREITDLLIAVNRSNGKSDYLPCIVWGINAEYARTIDVGEQITLKSGRFQSRVYTKVYEFECEKRTAYELSFGSIMKTI